MVFAAFFSLVALTCAGKVFAHQKTNGLTTKLPAAILKSLRDDDKAVDDASKSSADSDIITDIQWCSSKADCHYGECINDEWFTCFRNACVKVVDKWNGDCAFMGASFPSYYCQGQSLYQLCPRRPHVAIGGLCNNTDGRPFKCEPSTACVTTDDESTCPYKSETECKCQKEIAGGAQCNENGRPCSESHKCLAVDYKSCAGNGCTCKKLVEVGGECRPPSQCVGGAECQSPRSDAPGSTNGTGAPQGMTCTMVCSFQCETQKTLSILDALTARVCLQERDVCDGVSDCVDGSDERCKCGADEDCPAGVLCLNGKCHYWCNFLCVGGPCLPRSAICDGRPDCSNGSDESGCTEDGPSCEDVCRNGDCIEPSQRCNGKVDCNDESDESDCLCNFNPVSLTGKYANTTCGALAQCTDAATFGKEHCEACRFYWKELSSLRIGLQFASCTVAGRPDHYGVCAPPIDNECGGFNFTCALMSDGQICGGNFKCVESLKCLKATDNTPCDHIQGQSYTYDCVCASAGVAQPCGAGGGPSCPPTQRQLGESCGEPSECSEPLSCLDSYHRPCGNGDDNQCKCEIECGMRFITDPVAALGESAQRRRLIVHGEVAPYHIPWQVLLGFGCGGTLISPSWVLTAAHCVQQDGAPMGKISVAAGMLNSTISFELSPAKEPLQRRPGTVIFSEQHPFDPSILLHDIALVRVDPPFNMTRYVKPACLPSGPITKNDRFNTPLDHARGTREYGHHMALTSGWGATDPDGNEVSELLREANVYFLPCRDKVQLILKVEADHLCAGTVQLPGYEEVRDTCLGDSGGPLTHMEREEEGGNAIIVAGVVSFGIGCAYPKAFGRYVNVWYHMDFLLNKTGIKPRWCGAAYNCPTDMPVKPMGASIWCLGAFCTPEDCCGDNSRNVQGGAGRAPSPDNDTTRTHGAPSIKPCDDTCLTSCVSAGTHAENRSGASNEKCASCGPPTRQKFWPCNTKPPICMCGPDAMTSAPYIDAGNGLCAMKNNQPVTHYQQIILESPLSGEARIRHGEDECKKECINDGMCRGLSVNKWGNCRLYNVAADLHGGGKLWGPDFTRCWLKLHDKGAGAKNRLRAKTDGLQTTSVMLIVAGISILMVTIGVTVFFCTRSRTKRDQDLLHE